jgi:hypothetical protein
LPFFGWNTPNTAACVGLPATFFGQSLMSPAHSNWLFMGDSSGAEGWRRR